MPRFVELALLRRVEHHHCKRPQYPARSYEDAHLPRARRECCGQQRVVPERRHALLLAVPGGHLRQQQLLADLQPHGRRHQPQRVLDRLLRERLHHGQHLRVRPAFANGASIAAGGTYTVRNSGLAAPAPATSIGSYLRPYNGDDFVALINVASHTTADATNIVDQIGVFSTTDPGVAWPVCGTGSGMDTRNGRLMRPPTTHCGDSSGAAFDGSLIGPVNCPWTELRNSPSRWPRGRRRRLPCLRLRPAVTTAMSPTAARASATASAITATPERCTVNVLSQTLYASTTFFNTETYWDYITIGGTRYSGTAGFSNVQMTAGDTFTWFSDGSVNGHGFEICGAYHGGGAVAAALSVGAPPGGPDAGWSPAPPDPPPTRTAISPRMPTA